MACDQCNSACEAYRCLFLSRESVFSRCSTVAKLARQFESSHLSRTSPIVPVPELPAPDLLIKKREDLTDSNHGVSAQPRKETAILNLNSANAALPSQPTAAPQKTAALPHYQTSEAEHVAQCPAAAGPPDSPTDRLNLKNAVL
eukprot:762930-Hanusia_phi.AAC.2